MSTEKLLLLLAGLIDWTFYFIFIFLKAPYPHCFEFAFYFFYFFPLLCYEFLMPTWNVTHKDWGQGHYEGMTSHKLFRNNFIKEAKTMIGSYKQPQREMLALFNVETFSSSTNHN